jgi:hypothetical protein
MRHKKAKMAIPSQQDVFDPGKSFAKATALNMK